MTKAQMASVQLIFLLALPGAILGLGGLVWFRRRH
jgi:LPXTG-motif cell wall-anchored protein